MPEPDKQHLRQQMVARLRAAAAADPEGRRSAALRALLAPLLTPADRRSLRIGIYSPLPHEVNLLPLLAEYPQHHFCFPRCLKGHAMEFRIVRHPESDMEPAAMNIPAPKTTCPLVAPHELDILIVPGLAFTSHGERLGYGGGYYDRYMPRCPQARILALAFPEQMLDSLPTEEHDYPINKILCTRYKVQGTNQEQSAPFAAGYTKKV